MYANIVIFVDIKYLIYIQYIIVKNIKKIIVIIIHYPLSQNIVLVKVCLRISFPSENYSIVVVSESDLIMSVLANERRRISCDFC